MVTYGIFLKEMRTQADISQAKLCEGLCTVSMLSRIENGEREAGKLLRDRLLDRAGVYKRHFEEYLQPDEHQAWRARQELVWTLLNEDTDEALRQIAEYRDLFGGDALSDQFCEVTRAMALSVRRTAALSDSSGVSSGISVADYECEIALCYRRAMELSMPHLLHISTEALQESLLSIQELGILTEYYWSELTEQANDPGIGEGISFYKYLLTKIDNPYRDKGETVKLYPKAVVRYCDLIIRCGLEDKYSIELANLCRGAVELLRDQERSYYLHELTELLARLAPNDPYTQDCVRWRDACASLFRRYGSKLRVSCDAWIYIENGTYSIGDVIRRRRRMFGITQSGLCDGICSEKTLNRIENGKSSISPFIMKALFERLNLVPDYMHAEVLTTDREVLRSLEKLTWYWNNNRYEDFKQLLISIRNNLPMDNIINRQFWIRRWNIVQLKDNKISKEKYAEKLSKGLNLSILDKNNLMKTDVFLTPIEVMMLHNILLRGSQDNRKDVMACFRQAAGYNADDVMFMTHYYLLAFLMDYVASEVGNEEEYQLSNEMSLKIINTGIHTHYLSEIPGSQYNIIWNNQNNQKAECEQEISKEMLQECCSLSEFCHMELLFNFLQSKK